MITIYNEYHKKDKKDDQAIRSFVEDFFDNHQYLAFTNILVWIKEANPENSRGQVLFECAVEARLPGLEPIYVAKKNDQILLGVREALDTMRDEIVRKKKRMNERSQQREDLDERLL